MANFEIGSRRRLYCNMCKGDTHHELLAIHTRKYYEIVNENTPAESLSFSETFEYGFWICRGCDTATLEEAYAYDGMRDHKGDQIWDSTYYPKRAARDLPHKRFRRLNPKLASIYREVIDSFNNNSIILCAIGLRALLEGICADKEISGDNLYQKIKGLKTHLPSNIVESLHSFRFMGNEAAHELQAPETSELQLSIEVIEDLLNFLYELEYKAKRLTRSSSKRSSPSILPRKSAPNPDV